MDTEPPLRSVVQGAHGIGRRRVIQRVEGLAIVRDLDGHGLGLRGQTDFNLMEAAIVPVVYHVKPQLLEGQIHLEGEVDRPVIIPPEVLYSGGEALQFVQPGFDG